MTFLSQTIVVPAWWLGLAALAVIGFYSSHVHEWVASRGIPEYNNHGRLCGGIQGALIVLCFVGAHWCLPWGWVAGLVCIIWLFITGAIHPRGGN